MSSTTSNLTNINFMSETRFDNLSQINDDEIYAVKVAGLYGEQLVNQNPNGNPVKVWTGTQAEYDLITPDANTIYNITDSNNGNLFMTLLSEVLYPVGSIYIGTMNVCPLSALFGTWTLVSTKILTDIPSTLEAKGNGIAFGLTDGTNNFSLGTSNSINNSPRTNTKYGQSVGTASDSYTGSVDKTIGITTDSTKSGIVADTNATSLTVNIWKRTE